jgi:hypothetical protein
MPFSLLAAAVAVPVGTAIASVTGAVTGAIAGKYIFKNYDDWKVRADQLNDCISVMAKSYDALSDDQKSRLTSWVEKITSLGQRYLTGELTPVIKIVSDNAVNPYDLWSKLDDYFAGHERLRAFQEELISLNKDQGSVTGINYGCAVTVTENCDIFCKTKKLLWWGVGITAAYYGAKLLLDLYAHGDEIPRSQVPRYAGGTRRRSR